jgi:signal transduction histidine kinase
MAELELVIHQKGALIHFGRLPVVHGGRLLLYQLFYNLISNALKFSHAERTPEIAITAEVVAIGNKRWHIINVSDNGIGFDESNNEKIFETFSRLNSKDKYEGTGLGLSLCRKIVDRHQGVIYATGLKNKGANFIIELPE